MIDRATRCISEAPQADGPNKTPLPEKEYSPLDNALRHPSQHRCNLPDFQSFAAALPKRHLVALV
jgi:hypothetical protein